MEFRVLGPLEVRHAGDALALGGAKQQSVLALLVLRAPEPVLTEQLVDGLWGERPPSSAQHAVQVYVSGIRKLLRDTSSPTGHPPEHPTRPGLVRTLSGYQLLIDPEQVDARRFERLLEQGRHALRAQAFADADRTLGEAMSLWRGPALADFLYMDFARIDATRLEELRIEAVEARLEARVGLGHHAAVVGDLEALVAEHPLREHARWLLMGALYGAGRQADALAAYRDGHRILTEELGLEPGQKLRELEQAILNQTDVGQRVPPTGSDAAPSPRPSSARSPPRPPSVRVPLPAALRIVPLAGYVGREEEHELARKCWSEARAGLREGLLISGEPGVGKSEFTFRAAHEFHADGALVLYGHCAEELAAPYRPWIQALSPFVEHASDEVLAAYVERHGGELTRHENPSCSANP